MGDGDAVGVGVSVGRGVDVAVAVGGTVHVGDAVAVGEGSKVGVNVTVDEGNGVLVGTSVGVAVRHAAKTRAAIIRTTRIARLIACSAFIDITTICTLPKVAGPPGGLADSISLSTNLSRSWR